MNTYLFSNTHARARDFTIVWLGFGHMGSAWTSNVHDYEYCSYFSLPLIILILAKLSLF